MDLKATSTIVRGELHFQSWEVCIGKGAKTQRTAKSCARIELVCFNSDLGTMISLNRALVGKEKSKGARLELHGQ
jgi:hypothetical protein